MKEEFYVICTYCNTHVYSKICPTCKNKHPQFIKSPCKFCFSPMYSYIEENFLCSNSNCPEYYITHEKHLEYVTELDEIMSVYNICYHDMVVISLAVGKNNEKEIISSVAKKETLSEFKKRLLDRFNKDIIYQICQQPITKKRKSRY